MQYLVNEAGQKRFGELNYVIPSCFPEIGAEWYSRKPPENRPKVLDNIKQESHKVDYTYYNFFTCWDAYRPPIEAAFADGTDITAALTEAAQIHNEELTAAWEQFAA
jgi:CRISPR/Cas system CSM-associated protein Csm4 (group 5 of RAMP superfamily)